MRNIAKYGLILLLLLPTLTRAQLEADNWVFSTLYQYVNFNKATQPVLLANPGQACEAATTYSDRNGQLLFYSDGAALFNRNFLLSPSTDNNAIVNGIPGELLYSSIGSYTQEALAVPFPEHDSLYLLFHIYYGFTNNLKSELLYSVINMNMDSGRGGVDMVQRNIPLLGSLFNGTNVLFKLTAILHCNKKDIWIVGHLANSDKYFAFLITANGVNPTPVYSTGNFIPSMNFPDSINHPMLGGCIKVSPSGNRIAAAYKSLDFIELGDFDSQTGMVSNVKKIVAAPPPSDTIYYPIYIHRFHYGPDGVEFSPSGNKLYVSSNYEVMTTNSYFTGFLYQFDASLPSEAQVQNSRYFIDSIVNYRAGAIQLANNGKMYINFEGSLSEIADPENAGGSCNYTPLSILVTNQSFTRPLPIYLQSYLRYPVIATGNCQFQNITFSIQNLVGVTSVNWNFGDPASGVNNTSTSFNPIHIFSSQGIYTVTAILQNTNGCGADTIRKIVSAGPFKVFLGNDTTLCQGDTLHLRMNIPGASNLWSNNSIDTIIKVTQPGTYWVKVNLGDCFTSDTIVLSFRSLPQFSLGNDQVVCSSSMVTLSPVPNPPKVNYLWSNNATIPTITVNQAGSYWLRLTDNFGCKYRDTVNISFSQLPGFNLGSDTSICEKDTLSLNAVVIGASGYLWNTGAITATIKAFQPAVYWCDVTKDGCKYRDSLILIVKPLPLVDLGSDTTLCEDKTMLLNATNAGAQYVWQDASINPTYLITQMGQYFVKVTLNGCVSKDTIKINYDLKPKFSLGPDRLLCSGNTIILDPKINDVSYLWQDGSINKTYKATQSGLYYLAATNYCGTTTDSIILNKGVCDIYVPNAFTPNGDGLNDLFRPGYGDNIIEYKMEVFNRYGQLVFITSDRAKGWDGRINGKPQQAGAYTWIICYKTVVGSQWQNLSGSVILLK